MPFVRAVFLVSAASLIAVVAAHGTTTNFLYKGLRYDGIYPNDGNPHPEGTVGWPVLGVTDNGGPVDPTGYQSPDIICNKGAVPAPAHIPVDAGDDITFVWSNPWPDTHKGPVMDYLANCHGPCDKVDKESLEWFKLDGGGIVRNQAKSTDPTADWMSDYLIAQDSTWTITLPADLATGFYVARHETIALHLAKDLNGAQNYPFCLNLAVNGTGSLAPKGIKATEFYKPTDPGIFIEVRDPLDNYTIPGPPVYSKNSPDPDVVKDIVAFDQPLPSTVPAGAYFSASPTETPIVRGFTPISTANAPPAPTFTDIAQLGGAPPPPSSTDASSTSSDAGSSSSALADNGGSETNNSTPTPASQVQPEASPGSDASGNSSSDGPGSNPSVTPSPDANSCQATSTETVMSTVTVTVNQ